MFCDCKTLGNLCHTLIPEQQKNSGVTACHKTCNHSTSALKNACSLAGACREVVSCHADAAELAWCRAKHNPAAAIVGELAV
jgi:hypothetical protein